MPFSMAANSRNSFYTLHFRKISGKATNKKLVTLQVRILNNLVYHILYRYYGKKAFLSVPGSLTLEAVMCLTLFIFAAVCLILPMKIMNTERKLQAALEKVGEDCSQYAYVKDALEKGKLFAVAGAGDFAKEFCGHLASGAAQGYAQAQILNHMDTTAVTKLSLDGSQVMEDQETIDFAVEYHVRLPFPVLGLPAVERHIRCRRRAWIGKEGKDYDGTGAKQEDSDDTVVYIGKNSTRYHKSRNCHYLANNLSGVAVNQVKELRNNSGGIYYPCAVCGKSAGGTVYIMPSGSSYHSRKNCTAIMAYAHAVRLSEVEHLGACSYCGK